MHGCLNEGHPETPRTSQHYGIERLKRVPKLGLHQTSVSRTAEVNFSMASNLDQETSWMQKLHGNITQYFSYTQINLFEILLNQPEIRLYLPFSDWFGTNQTFVWFQINRKMINTIWFRFGLTRFELEFSACCSVSLKLFI